jgi:hypothetical protein
MKSKIAKRGGNSNKRLEARGKRIGYNINKKMKNSFVNKLIKQKAPTAESQYHGWHNTNSLYAAEL